jgi:hypothetical protein
MQKAENAQSESTSMNPGGEARNKRNQLRSILLTT